MMCVMLLPEPTYVLIHMYAYIYYSIYDHTYDVCNAATMAPSKNHIWSSICIVYVCNAATRAPSTNLVISLYIYIYIYFNINAHICI